MKTLIATLAIALTISGVAHAGGSPDENDFGAGTRKALPQVIPDQYEIQKEVEAEIFSKPQIKPEPLRSMPVAEPVIIADASPKSECWAPFRWIDPNCYVPGDYYEGSQADWHTVDVERTTSRTTQVCFPDSKRGRRDAKKFERMVNGKRGKSYAEKRGYDSVKGELTSDGLHVDLTLTKTIITRQKRRGDGPGRSGRGSGTASNSNGMAHGGSSGIDSGNW